MSASHETRTIVIAGAGSGLAHALAERFADGQSRIVLVGNDLQAGARAVEQLRAHAIASSCEHADLRDARQCAALVQRMTAQPGRIHVWINAHAVHPLGPAESLATSDWQACLDSGLSATFYACQAVAQHMLAHANGVILNIASMQGYYHQARHVAPGVAMAGIIALTQALGIEWAARGVRVAGIAHGSYDTDAGKLPATSTQPAARRIPLRRPATLKELAEAAFFLASPEASYVVGETLRVDGGFGAYQLF